MLQGYTKRQFFIELGAAIIVIGIWAVIWAALPEHRVPAEQAWLGCPQATIATTCE
jgi:hypothetical protein